MDINTATTTQCHLFPITVGVAVLFAPIAGLGVDPGVGYPVGYRPTRLGGIGGVARSCLLIAGELANALPDCDLGGLDTGGGGAGYSNGLTVAAVAKGVPRNVGCGWGAARGMERPDGFGLG